jgi:hypothetical protein
MAASSREEREKDLHAELGYRTAGQREVSLREWFSLQGEKGEPLATPKAFASAIAVLRAKRWAKNNPERKAEISRRWAHAHAAEKVVQVKRWRHRKTKARVFVCASPECDVSWCRVPSGRLHGNIRIKFCSARCRNRAKYLRRGAVSGGAA